MNENFRFYTVFDNGKHREAFSEYKAFLEAFYKELDKRGLKKDQITLNKTSNLSFRLVLEDRAYIIEIWDVFALIEFENEFKDQISHELDLTHKFVNHLYFDCKGSIYDYMYEWMAKNDLDLHELDKLYKDFIRAIRIEF